MENENTVEIQEFTASAPIGKEQIEQAQKTLEKYRSGKQAHDTRLIENEKWWRLRNWENIDQKNKNDSDPEPVTAWLHNSINNKHADFMDNFPTANILPREESDKTVAEALSSIVPVIFENNGFEQTYSRCCLNKLLYGSACYGVFWNAQKNFGQGDVEITRINLLNFFWEPGIEDIQKSRNIFSVTLVDNDLLLKQYPEQLEGKLTGGESGIDIKKFAHDDNIDTSEKSLVIDWYYKNYVNGREILHYVKFVNDIVLFASENEPERYSEGFYKHGMYPFVMDPLFAIESSPSGYGYIDVGKNPQKYIDELNQIILKNSLMASRPRYAVKNTAGINLNDFSDWKKEIITVSGDISDSNIRELTASPLPATAYNVLLGKVDELKETTGNRDFSQGGTTSGVTAASAIAALQEAGNKLARDMIKGSYWAHTEVCRLVVELIREFYNEPRVFRITGTNGEMQFTKFNNTGMLPQAQGSDFGLQLGKRVPIFDIKINSQKSSPFNRLAQNENAKEMYNLGFFNPDMASQALIALDMMDFEGKEAVVKKISEQNALYQQVQQLSQQVIALASMVQGQAQMPSDVPQGTPMPSGANGGTGITVDSLGNATAQNGHLERARARAEGNTQPE